MSKRKGSDYIRYLLHEIDGGIKTISSMLGIMLFILLFNNQAVLAESVNALPLSGITETLSIQTADSYSSIETKTASIIENPKNIDMSLSSPVKEKIILSEEAVPNSDCNCKSYNFTYMDWKKVTCKSSLQYWVLNDVNAWTNEITGIRMVNDRICIAVGQGYGFIPGDMIDVYLTSGDVIECIIGDMKATTDCDITEKYQATDGSVVEIIIDDDYFSSTSQYPDELQGTVEKLVLVSEE